MAFSQIAKNVHRISVAGNFLSWTLRYQFSYRSEVAMEWSERIGRRIRLRDLHILLAIVQCKSLAKAAEQLAISRPVVSRAIADLEHVLGVRLLERDRHGAEPTVYGAALLKRGIAVFDELRGSVKDIEFLADPTAGEVRIGSTPPLSASFVTAVVERLCERYPRITFQIEVSETEWLRRALVERNVDFLIVRKYATRLPDELSFEALYDDPFVVTVGAQSPWARRRKVELAELADEWWAMPPPESEPGSFFAEIFRAKGLDYPRAKVVSFPIGMRTSLLTTGRFVTILPLSVLRFPAKPSTIKELPIELPTVGPVGVATLKNRALSPSARLFVDSAREIAKPLAKRK
jgi:DNA-binding transcriptional LysR family regulator